MKNLSVSLIPFFTDPYNADINFIIANAYQENEQYAAAISFYMRAAEYAEHSEKKLIYKSLISAAELFLKLGARITSVKSLVLQASSILPHDPIAYNLLSKVYEIEKNWIECYVACEKGLYNYLLQANEIEFDTKLEEELLFNLATSSYYIGKLDKAKLLFGYLDYKKLDYSKWIQEGIKRSLEYVGYPVLYSELTEFKNVFKPFILKQLNKNNVTNFISYSQCLQDLFIASIVDKDLSVKTYIEIGSGDPIHNNNTYLLEQLGWKGVSFDIDSTAVEKFNSIRKNKAIVADATKVNYLDNVYITILTKIYVDYLQFDCEPPEVTLAALYTFPFDSIKAKLITFEHDGYRSPEVKEKSREYLKNLGYELVISDVSFNKNDSFEDWYCNREVMTIEEYEQCLKYKNIKNYTKSIFDIFLI